ncbi:MAG: hypothetical protein EPN94_00440 [Nitrospirae bacterium]|nr:MAG: hypothetical protein EPN94_00440 [Nitrospirota bacterium]
METIKRKSEWEILGFKPKADRFGNYKPVRKNGLFFGFSEVTRPDNIKADAIKTGKKYTKNPKDILAFINFGCAYSDFIAMSDDVKNYCEAFGKFKVNRLSTALEDINKALAVKPKEHAYNELFFDIMYHLKDISAISGDIAFHIETYGGISAMVHCGNAERWLKLLLALGEQQRTDDFVNVINHHLDSEIAKKSIYNPPQGIKYIVNGSEAAGEQLAMTVSNNELAFVKSCKDKFNSRVSKLRKR